MIKKLFAAIVLGALLQGCATSSDVYLADGSKGHNIQCGGTVMNFSDCLEKAGEICGEKGYLVVNREGSASPFSTASGGSGGFSGVSGGLITRSLFIKCKDGKPQQ